MPTYTSPSTHVLTVAAGMSATTGYGLTMQYLRDAFLACGWVQTADTGQLTLGAAGSTTVPASNSGNVSLGYFIFRMADALQATKPVFVKIGLWAGNQAGNFSGFTFEVGEGSNGAGALTGRRVGRNLLWVVAAASGTNWPSGLVTYAAGNPGEIVLSFHEPSTSSGVSLTDNQTALITIERTRDANGVVDGEGVLVGWAYNSDATNGGLFNYTLAFPTNGSLTADQEANIGFIRGGMVPVRSRDQGITSINNGNVLGPFFPTHFGLFPKYRQTRLAFLYPHNDIPWNTTFKMEINGVERTFRASGYPVGRKIWANTPMAAAGFTDWGSGADLGVNARHMAVAHLWE